MSGKSDWFIVRRSRRWVATLDGYDGSMDYTSDERLARLFYAPYWHDFWAEFPDAELHQVPALADQPERQ